MKKNAYKAVAKEFEKRRKILDKKCDAVEKAWAKKFEALEAAEDRALDRLEKQCLKDHGEHKYDKHGYCTRCNHDVALHGCPPEEEPGGDESLFGGRVRVWANDDGM